jgi:hypothetical protein
MMASNLLGDYSQKQLNEVVFPGAHDAGTFAANLGDNVRTQSVSVGKQAGYGCRYFDIRVAQRKVGSGATATIVPTTFHAPSIKSHTSKKAHGNVYNKLGTGGGWGDTLNTILGEARSFVEAGATSSEFLILRFSKCGDYNAVVNACNVMLAGCLYKTGGNLNTAKLSTLAGKVITVYVDNHGKKPDFVPAQYTPAGHGVIRIKELFNKDKTPKAYVSGFNGFQYYGKHGDTKNAATNAERQLKRASATVHRDAVGMMYWTLTGIAFKGSILSRNNNLWKNSSLRQTWESGLRQAIENRRPDLQALRQQKALSSQDYKSFMPNIVMMDEVNQTRCDTVHGLNAVSNTVLGDVFDKDWDAGMKNDPKVQESWAGF